MILEDSKLDLNTYKFSIGIRPRVKHVFVDERQIGMIKYWVVGTDVDEQSCQQTIQMWWPMKADKVTPYLIYAESLVVMSRNLGHLSDDVYRPLVLD